MQKPTQILDKLTSPIRTLRSVLRFRRFERDRTLRRLARAANTDDLRALAERRLPRGVFDYIDGAAEDEVSLELNQQAFRRVGFSPEVLNDVGSVDTRSTLLGRPLKFPLVLAPTGFTRIADPDGELAVARAASRAGVPYTLATLATRSIEEVAAVSSGDLWFQVYVWRDRGLVAELLQRASASGYRAIVITVDTAVLGRRERDVRRGFSLPPKIGLDTVIDGIRHPGWTWDFARAEPIVFANVSGQSVGDGTDPVSLAEYINTQFDPTLSWKDIEWFREHWSGPIVLKGIQRVSDAEKAAAIGIEAVALSNHGGRQFDGAPSPLDLVAPVAAAVGENVEIICDGGIRRGSDIVKALALGANACMAGRAYLHGLGAGGEHGVDQVLRHLNSGVDRTMALCGRSSIAELDPSIIRQIQPYTTAVQ